MKVALTGASGYLGQLVLPLLERHKEVDSLLGLDIIPGPFRSPRYVYQAADLCTADFTALLAGVDVLYHLAFVVEPPRRLSMAEIDAINVEGSKRALRGAVAAGVSKIVFASSIAAYGAHADNPETLTEAAPLRPNPDWYYSRAKGAVESFLDELQQDHPELAVIRFRPSTFLGPSLRNVVGRQYDSRVLIGLTRNHRIDYCWDGDVAEAFVLALAYTGSGIFNLAGGNPLTLDDAGELLGKKVLYLPRGPVSLLVKVAEFLGLAAPGTREWVDVATRGSICASADRARALLGWQPRYDSAGALREFAAQRAASRGNATGQGRRR